MKKARCKPACLTENRRQIVEKKRSLLVQKSNKMLARLKMQSMKTPTLMLMLMLMQMNAKDYSRKENLLK